MPTTVFIKTAAEIAHWLESHRRDKHAAELDAPADARSRTSVTTPAFNAGAWYNRHKTASWVNVIAGLRALSAAGAAIPYELRASKGLGAGRRLTRAGITGAGAVLGTLGGTIGGYHLGEHLGARFQTDPGTSLIGRARHKTMSMLTGGGTALAGGWGGFAGGTYAGHKLGDLLLGHASMPSASPMSRLGNLFGIQQKYDIKPGLVDKMFGKKPGR